MKSRYVLVHLPPFIHLVGFVTFALVDPELCLYHMVRIDIPMSIIAIALAWYYGHLLIWLGVLGTLWWYLLARAAEIVVKAIGDKKG